MNIPSYFPRSHEEKSAWVRNLVSYVNEHGERMKINAAYFQNLPALADRLDRALAKCREANAGKLDRQAKNEALEAMVEASHRLAKGCLISNVNVNESDRIAMKLPPLRAKIKASARPNDSPRLEFHFSRPLSLDLRHKGKNGRAWGKPRDVVLLEIRHGVMDESPQSPAALPDYSFSSKSPASFSFEADKRGTTFYAAGRWINRKGETGPWCELISQVVP
jgi:hypothetical protein